MMDQFRKLRARVYDRASVWVKDAACHSPLHPWFFRRYPFMFTPSQLAFLVDCLNETDAVEGSIVEIGCAFGETTVFLNRHLDELGTTKRYLCIDTFKGFTGEDVAVERHRGKWHDYGEFRANNVRWFERRMVNSGIDRVEVHIADAANFDYSLFGPVSFALVDVDLYRPVRAALLGLAPRMSLGGIVVVDDCEDDSRFDGALAAFHEAGGSMIVEKKLGVLRF
jgi:hypothetical protein